MGLTAGIPNSTLGRVFVVVDMSLVLMFASRTLMRLVSVLQRWVVVIVAVGGGQMLDFAAGATFGVVRGVDVLVRMHHGLMNVLFEFAH